MEVSSADTSCSGGRVLPAEAGRPSGAAACKSGQARPLPFALSAEHLTATLGSALTAADGRERLTEEAVIWLPTVKGQPVASSPLIAEPPLETDAELAPWEVSALPMRAGPAIALLTACLDRTNLAPGLVVGTTLSYWSAALRYAGALLAREQFLPVVAQTTSATWGALWEPVRPAPKVRGLATGAGDAAACRARLASQEPPTRPAAECWIVISLVVDELVRSAAKQSWPTLARRGRRRAPAFDSMRPMAACLARAERHCGQERELTQLTEQVSACPPALWPAAV